VLAGAAFAFAVSVGEFDATVVLAEGGGTYTMPVAVERYVGRRLGPATAMGTVLLLVTAVSFVVLDRVGGGGVGGFGSGGERSGAGSGGRSGDDGGERSSDPDGTPNEGDQP